MAPALRRAAATSAAIATSARLSGPNSGAKAGSSQHGQRLGRDVLADLRRQAGQPGSPGRPRRPRAQLSLRKVGQVLEQRVGERAAQEAAVVGQRDGRQDRRLGRPARLPAQPARSSSASHFQRRQTRGHERHGEHRLARRLGLRPSRQRRRRHGQRHRALGRLRGLAVCSTGEPPDDAPVGCLDFLEMPFRPSLMRLYQQLAGGARRPSKPATYSRSRARVSAT